MLTGGYASPRSSDGEEAAKPIPRTTGRAGEGIPDYSWDRVSLYACFLAGAGENCYFCHTWGWLGEYGTFDRYPEFGTPLGPPKGVTVREGWTYRREFAHASVWVDPEKRSARIDWR